jgi:hypothetical protein
MSIDLVKSYVSAREAKDIDGVLATVADDLVFTDASGSVSNGKAEFRKYLNENPPLKSEWQDPVAVGSDVVLKGKVRKFMMWWDLEVTFVVGAGAITSITIVRK